MPKKESVLKSLEKKIEVKVSEKYSPSEFFKDRKGLFVWVSFKDNILAKAKNTTKTEFSLNSFELLKNSFDEGIEEDLPKKHFFSETEVCAVIASLIEKQPKGEEGVLLNSGYANIFYTPSRVVGVFWGGGGWGVGAWGRGVYWYGDGRVFSPATEA